jgi:hypothetical protein
MQTFQTIGVKLLEAYGLEAKFCSSEQEARQIAASLKDTDTHYPVYFFESDTSGEKPYEEFYTDQEDLVMDRFTALGFVRNAPKQSVSAIDAMFAEFQQLFNSGQISKESIVTLMKNYIPNFDHIEKGKNLDQRM